MNASAPEKEPLKEKNPENDETLILSDDPTGLTNDPDFIKLLEHYQHAEFGKCSELLAVLENRYPDHPRLLRFKDDLQLKLSLKTITIKSKKEQKNKVRNITFRMTVFAIISSVLLVVALLFSYYYLSNKARIEQEQRIVAQLSSLNDQAEQLILAGRPQPAAQIIEKIRSINPEYANLPELTSKADDLLRLEIKYQSALDLISQKKNDEALVILKELDAERPGMWDVNQQIAAIENSNLLAKYLEEGNAAFEKENWDKVLSSYENALILAPKLDDPQVKERLLRGYLNKIISLLQNDSTSTDDIENAELYYRRAVALIPQSKAYSSERVNLEEVSSDLLVLKFTQTARALLEDKNQTVSTVAKAVSYLRKAANIKPKNTALQSDLTNAEYYQIAFQNFVEMEWVPTITNLAEIVAVDPNYAKGNASILLYEAYYALGKEYFSVGLYLDARRELEQAEIMAWNDKENLLKLFQVQVLLGDAIAKTRDYKNAVSYYKFALDAIDAKVRLQPDKPLSKQLLEAETLSEAGNFADAVPIYQELLQGIAVINTVNSVEIDDGLCLAFFASENLSTVDAIIEANNLSKSMIITFGRTLKVPTISN